jgi:DNA helicase-2/ATP-dependent DNA helicase PcrA
MYLLRDLWGYQPELNQAIGYGNGMHYCLRRTAELIKVYGYNPVEAVSIGVDEGFHMPFVGGEVLHNFRSSARRKLMNFASQFGDDLKRIEEVEYRLEFPIRNATIMGKVDVILRDGGGIEVRDYKTSEEARSFEEISHQVRLYAGGLKSMGRSVTGGSVAYLEEAKVMPVDVSEAALADEKRKAEEIVVRIMGEEQQSPGNSFRTRFGPSFGSSCERCDQRPICRRAGKLNN